MNYRVMPKSDQLPYALYRAEQVRALDATAINQFGIPGRELMARAGEAAFELLIERWPDAQDVTVVVGTGNNGGDGYVVASLAKQAGMRVRVLQLGESERISGDAKFFAEEWLDSANEYLEFTDLPRHTDVIVDGILGTGLEREVKGEWADAIRKINAHRAPVLALDIPSGLHSDTGAVMGVAVKAECSISFIGLKQGMFTGEAPDYCGEISFDALDVPAQIYASQLLSARRIEWKKVKDRLSPRRRTAHKGHFGHVLVVGGDYGFGGAALMAATAAARTGAGLVSLATRPEHIAAAISTQPEIMAHAIAEADQLDPLLMQASVVVLGPGLGQSPWGLALWNKVIQSSRLKVMDADALNLLAMQPMKSDNWVLTPHPGEAARLLGVCIADTHQDRISTANTIVKRFGGSCVLKGAGSVIATQGDYQPAICSEGNPGMASGGMGDVLSGVIGGFLAQGHDLDEATQLGVCLHAAAADVAANRGGEFALLATDLIDEFANLLP